MPNKSEYFIFKEQPAHCGIMSDFINLYSNWYYIGEKCVLSPRYQCSKWAENEIMNILDRGIQNSMDVFHILAWKIGGIDHKSSNEDHPIPLIDGWQSANPMKGVHRGKNIENIGALSTYIASRVDIWRTMKKSSSWSKDDAHTIINEIWKYKQDNDVTQIGSVHIITLLFFITQGEFPIYDQEAMKALIAIRDGKQPGSEIEFKDLLDISSPRFWERYQKYIDLLKKFFKEDYKRNRKIDQALWVYGHLFKRKL